MKLDRVFGGLNISSQGLSAQRQRMNVIAENLANAETSKTERGGPYRRKIVQLKAKGAHMFSSLIRQASVPMATTSAGHFAGGEMSAQGDPSTAAVVETSEAQDSTPPRMVYDPSHPDADADGYVAMPNINIVTEMVNMISASRAFEANVIAVNAAKTMAKDSLEI
jgi:flagellar basal-body rod protein FlgC